MIGLIVNKQMSLKYKGFNKLWITLKSSNNEWFFLKEAEQDLIDNGIEYTIGEIEIKQEIE
jgi:hypothetical protein